MSSPTPCSPVGTERVDERRSVVVAVATYQRPDHLARCLRALVRECEATRAGQLGLAASVLVVDNDPDGSAGPVAANFADRGVCYVLEPRPGIAAARNRALCEAKGVDLLAFVDDDEEPVDGWLAMMVDTRDRYEAAAVAGRVVSDLDDLDDDWIRAGAFFRRRTLPTGSPIGVGATNNLLLDLHTINRLGLRFDDRYGLSGGSDTDFTRRLVRAGGRLVWCDEAVMVDNVPSHRLTREWVLARAQRMGNTHVVVDVDLASPGLARFTRRVAGAAAGTMRIVGGAVQALLGRVARSLRWQAVGAKRLARGRGMLSAAVGRHVAEYERADSVSASPGLAGS